MYTLEMCITCLKDNIKKWAACDCDNVKEDHNVFMYDVKEEDNSGVPLVAFDSINETIVCNCKKNWVCKHAM